jgi:hypothetical protein
MELYEMVLVLTVSAVVALVVPQSVLSHGILGSQIPDTFLSGALTAMALKMITAGILEGSIYGARK